MAQQIAHQILIRLILVKQAYYRAVQSASEQTDIGNIFAIQQLDFAIETLLKTVISHKGSPTAYNAPQSYYKSRLAHLTNEPYRPDSPFPRLFDEVVGIYRDQSKGIGKDTPPLRQEIELIHDMRNDAQHNGISPSSPEVQRRLGFGENFISSVLSGVFNLNFDQIMLASLINDVNVRNNFQNAEIAFNRNNFSDAINDASVAFRRAMDIAYKRFLQFRGLGMPVVSSFDLRDREIHQQVANSLEDLSDAIEELREELEPIILGVDPINYLEFLKRSPHVDNTLNGTYKVPTRKDGNPTKEDAIIVLNFVFSTLIRWRI